MIELVCGDCLKEMTKIKDESVDLILCDLPYGTTACHWDVIIPFDKLWESYKRIITHNGNIVLFGSQPFTSLLINSNIKWFRESLVWLKNKSGSGLNYNTKHIKIHEDIVVFSQNSTHIFNPQKWLIAEKEFITQRKTFKENEYIGNQIYNPTTRIRKPDTGERNPISIVSCRVPFTPQKNKQYATNIDLRYHPTQKPVELLEYLIKTYSNEGDTVLDNCMGSGSTGVACKNLNRSFIGIEKDKKYFDIAKDRIENV